MLSVSVFEKRAPSVSVFYDDNLLGTSGNAVALWCVTSCTKTRRPMKVLLMSVFVPVLLICVVSRPAVIETLLTLISCDKSKVSIVAVIISVFVYSILAQSELASIAVVAVVRYSSLGQLRWCFQLSLNNLYFFVFSPRHALLWYRSPGGSGS